MRWTVRLRQVVNLVNLSTPAGLLVGRVLGGATLSSAGDGLVVATGSRLPQRAPVMTIGNVLILRAGTDPEMLIGRPELLQHEARHATQYAWCLGVIGFGPLYGLSTLWSVAWAGDRAAYNVFERLAGLADGGYRSVPSRWARRRLRAGSR